MKSIIRQAEGGRSSISDNGEMEDYELVLEAEREWKMKKEE